MSESSIDLGTFGAWENPSSEQVDDPAGRTLCEHPGTPPGAGFCGACGAALDHGEGLGVLAVWRAAPRVTRRRRIIGGLLAVVLVLALGGLYWLEDAWYSPNEPVERLLTAMREADGPALRDMITESGSVVRDDLAQAAKDSPLLADGGLSEGYSPPSDLRVEDVRYGGPKTGDYTQRENREYATVTVSYTLGGDQHEVGFMVDRASSGWWREWRLWPDQLLTRITVDVGHTDKGTYRIAGAHTDDATLYGLPGSYTVTADADRLYAAATEHVNVGLGDDTVVSFDGAKPKKTVAADVRTGVRAFVDRCAAGGPPDNACGFDDEAGRAGYVPDSAKWDIEKYPTLEFKSERIQDSDFMTNSEAEQTLLVVSTKTSGKAVGKYKTILDDTKTIDAAINVNGFVSVGEDGHAEFVATNCPPTQKMCLLRGR